MILLLYLETYSKRNSRVPSEAESLSQTQKRRRPFILQFAPNDHHRKKSRRFQFNKRGQPFIGAHNEALSVAAMRISNPDRSSVGI
jgi:hypothetical protein